MPDYSAMAKAAARKHGIDPEIFDRQMRLESMNYNPDVISGKISSPAGAKGIAQIMEVYHPNVNPLDVEAALDYAAGLMASHLKTYGGRYDLSLAAYNAGAGNVQKYGGVPPFQETQTYVSRIMGGQGQPQAAGGATMGEETIGEYWEDNERKDDKGRPVQYDSPPKGNTGINGTGFGPNLGNTSYNVTHHRIVIDEQGRIYDITDDGAKRYIKTDPQVRAQYNADNKQPSGPTTKQGPDGTEYIWDENRKTFVPAPGIPSAQASDKPKYSQYTDPMTGEVWIIDETGRHIKKMSEAPPGWLPGRGMPPMATPRQERYPEEIELTKLQIEKARRDLTDDTTRARQEHMQLINAIQQQLATGQIDEAEANRLIGLSKAKLEATLRGATPFQIEQDKRMGEQWQQSFDETRRNNQNTLARGILSDRMSLGGNMAQSLLTGAQGIYGKILPGQGAPTNFNPLMMAQQFTNEMGGGPEMGQMAQSLLKGALEKTLAQQGGL